MTEVPSTCLSCEGAGELYTSLGAPSPAWAPVAAGGAGWQPWGGPPHLTGSWQQMQLDVGVRQPVVVHRLQALSGGGTAKGVKRELETEQPGPPGTGSAGIPRAQTSWLGPLTTLFAETPEPTPSELGGWLSARAIAPPPTRPGPGQASGSVFVRPAFLSSRSWRPGDSPFSE